MKPAAQSARVTQGPPSGSFDQQPPSVGGGRQAVPLPPLPELEAAPVELLPLLLPLLPVELPLLEPLELEPLELKPVELLDPSVDVEAEVEPGELLPPFLPPLLLLDLLVPEAPLSWTVESEVHAPMTSSIENAGPTSFALIGSTRCGSDCW
jgi:hypothetical protein